ncbi:MAG: hypothetical protein Q7R35_14930 [Elusimicrobiota bacterium]|nr:hypothetical protein [Elusimicrobiota bacterium]
MNSSLLGKIKYKKERLGVVEKNGKTYVKYAKVRRFKLSRTSIYIFVSVFILVVFGLGLKLLLSELYSRDPIVETAEVGS